MSLPGLPPLPKSLSDIDHTGILISHKSKGGVPSFDALRGVHTANRMTTMSATTSNMNTLESQMATLRKEMFGLRQLDLSLLTQLWALNEAIQQFRSILQEQENVSPPSPSGSSCEEDDVSVSMIDEIIQIKPLVQRMRSAPPPPPAPIRKPPQKPV